MLRSRRKDRLVPSPYQCKPRSLIYSLQHPAAYHTTAAHDLQARVRRFLPPEHHAGWNAIAQGEADPGFHRPRSPATDEAAAFLAANPDITGCKPPTTVERSHMLGIGDFGPALQLTDLQLYNAQGNAFDRTALMMRIRAGLLAWARGDHLPPADFLPPSALVRAYDALLAAVDQDEEARGRGERTPFPAHVAGLLHHAEALLASEPLDAAVAALRAGHAFSPTMAAPGGRAAP